MTINIYTSTGTQVPATAEQLAQVRADLGAASAADVQAAADAAAAAQAMATSASGAAAAAQTSATNAASAASAAQGAADAAAGAAQAAQATATSAASAAASAQSTATSAASAAATAQQTADASYVKPPTGIPAADMATAVQASLAKADAALPATPAALAGMLTTGAQADPQSMSVISAAVGRAREYVPAGNRFVFSRRQSNASPGLNMMSVRWHRSPPVDIDGLVAVWYAGYQHQTLGLQPIGNDLSVAAAVMYPAGSSPGAAKAFKRAGSTTIEVPNGAIVMSDPLSVLLPANTPYRLRSFVSPGAAGYIPYGMPGMGAANGGSLSGFGTENDQVSYVSGQTDTTQASTAHTTNATNDTMFEPFVIARPAGYWKVWGLNGDSRTYGALEVGVGGGATASGAGDAYGNHGMWARACGINGHGYLNLGISGSQLNTWATDGYSDFLMQIGAMSCTHALIALGTNDTLSYTAEQIMANLQKMVRKYRALGYAAVYVATLPPRTTSTDGFATTANQTIDAVRSPRITTLNGYLRAGQLSGATIIDQGAMCEDATDPQKWRTDLGFISTTDGTHETPQMIAWLATQLAPLMA